MTTAPSTSSHGLIGFLKSLGPFSHLTPAGLAGLLRVVEPREYQDGAKIIARGDPGDAMYIVQTGEVRIPLRNPDGSERMEKLGAGSFFGEMSLITGEPRTADVFAVGPTRALVVRKEAFHELLHKLPSLSKFLTDVIAKRFFEADLSSRSVGKYRLVSLIGRGDRSIVYEGTDPVRKRRVAVKMLNHRLGMDPEFRKAYEADMRALTELEHENIVRIYEIEHAYATLFVIMEFVDGQLISKRLEKGHPLRSREVREILKQCCRGLEYAHRRGIVHRAIEPSNIFIGNDGRVKLADFGLVSVPRVEAEHPDEGVGDPAYMSPEQLAGKPLDARADIYAVGVLGFHMLIGTLPRRSAVAAEPFPSLRALKPALPGDLLEFVERATSPDPDARYQTAAEAERAFGVPEPEDEGPAARGAVAAGGPAAGAAPLPAGAAAALEGRFVTVLFRPADAARVDGAIAALRDTLRGVPGTRVGTAPISL